MNKLTIRDLDAAGKRVFVRVDFNVPLEDGKITDDSRIVAALPTIKALLAQGAIVILASHLGRPDGKVQDSMRLRPVAERLSQLLKMPVPVTGDALGVGTEDAIKRLKPGEVHPPREPALPRRGREERSRRSPRRWRATPTSTSTTPSARPTAPTPAPRASPDSCRPTPAC